MSTEIPGIDNLFSIIDGVMNQTKDISEKDKKIIEDMKNAIRELDTTSQVSSSEQQKEISKIMNDFIHKIKKE